MRTLILLLVLVSLGLVHRLLLGEANLAELERLERQAQREEAELAGLAARNAALAAEVEDLRTGLAAIEERARTDLGMIRPGETYYRVIEPAR